MARFSDSFLPWAVSLLIHVLFGVMIVWKARTAKVSEGESSGVSRSLPPLNVQLNAGFASQIRPSAIPRAGQKRSVGIVRSGSNYPRVRDGSPQKVNSIVFSTLTQGRKRSLELKLPGLEKAIPPSLSELWTGEKMSKGMLRAGSATEALSSGVGSQQLLAFDLLASQINRALDFPDLLVQEGIEGIAQLELSFKSETREGLTAPEGSLLRPLQQSIRIDEAGSSTFGSNAWVRGLLIQAVRKAVPLWVRTLSPQFDLRSLRNQVFRAEFELSSLLESKRSFEKSGISAYRFQRRVFLDPCLRPGILDISCLARRGWGAVKKRMSEDHKLRIIALKGRLEELDQLGLQGLNSVLDRIRSI